MILADFLSGIADAIRYAENSTEEISAQSFSARIRALGGIIPVIERVYRDTVIIPDTHNTGCDTSNLTKYAIGTSPSYGLYWYGDTQTVLDCNNGKSFRDVLDAGTIVFENYDFTDYPKLGLTNAWDESATRVPTNCHIKFKNCLFRKTEASYPIYFSKDLISFEFENCTMEGASFVNATYKNCKIGGSSYFRSLGFTTDTGFESNTRGRVAYKNCYFYDIETVQETAGTGHIDGFQNNKDVEDVTFENCRFECIDMAYPSQGGWSYVIFWQGINTNGIIKDCILNGGGYYSTSIKLDDSQSFENVLVNSTYSTPFYPSDDGYLVNVNTPGWGFTPTAYISSVWEENGTVHYLCSNDLDAERSIKVVTDKGEDTFTIAAGPKFNQETNLDWSEFPFDVEKTIPFTNINYAKFYDGDTLIRTYIK